MSVSHGSLPFEEAEQFFRDKIRIPTRRWDDLKHGMHARGFMIAGAQRDDMLCDFQMALTKAIAQGTTLEAFRKDFDRIVATYGWSYNGGRGWRTRVIYDTNLRTSYMAGRYAQMTDPDVLSYRQDWMYQHNDARHPRPLHVSWSGLVLRWDDPWWSSHYPPNGWGCHCSVVPLSKRDMGRLGKTGPDQAPLSPIDPKTGEPVGIDRGWGYNVGEAAWGKNLSTQVMKDWRAQGTKAWETLTPGDFRSANRPERVPVDKPRAAIGPRYATQNEAAAALKTIIDGEQKFYATPAGGQVLVDAESLADHLDLEQSPYLPLLPEAIVDPYEIWLSFEQHKGTGKVELRQRLIKAVKIDKDRLLLTAQVKNGVLEDWTMTPGSNDQRKGKLLWGRN